MKHIIGIIVVAVIGLAVWQLMHSKPIATVTEEGSSDSKIVVVASIYPLAYLAERIAGEHASVINIGENQDPHDFRPSAQDMQTMQNADVVILQGAGLEPWGESVQEQLEQAGTPVLVASANLDLFEMGEHDDQQEEHHEDDDHDDHGHSEHRDEEEAQQEEHHEDEHAEHADHHGHDHGAFDPHTWLDPILSIEVAPEITKQLTTLDPAKQSNYEANLDALTQDLAAINAEYASTLSQCRVPEVITSHDAFGYLARRYGFKIHAIGGLSTQDTPSALTLAKLKEEAEEGITTILLEENSIASYGETLARETGLATGSISPILYNIPQGQDYLSFMRSNLESLEQALDCHAHE